MSGSRRCWSGIVMVFMCLIISMSSANAQRITGQSAAEAFSKGDFSNAYKQYSTLLESFPRDPAYLYGAGACLIKLSERPEEATDLLSRAIAASSSVRSAPADTRFYLARALHLSGRFDDAVREYEKYADAAGRRDARDKDIAGFIEQCNNRRGVIVDARPATDVSELRAAIAVEESDTAKHIDPVALQPAIVITPPDTLSKQTDTLLTDALSMRINVDTTDTVSVSKSDSLLNLAGVPVAQRKAAQSVMTLSEPANANRPAADSVKSGTKSKESAGLASDTLTTIDTAKASSPVQQTVDTMVLSRQITEVTHAIVGDTLASNTIKGTVPPQQTVRKEPVTSLFALKEPPHYSRTNPVTVSTTFPKGLLYTVQLAVFRNPVDPSYFKRLYPVFGVKSPERELTFYYSGLFRTMADASKPLQIIRNEGFSDAFVTIFMDGKAVSAERGTILEKEWGTRGLPEWAGVVPENTAHAVAADTVPPTLLFRVEVMRINKENKEISQEISRVAGDRGFEIMNPTTGIYVYIVGKFLTFESASAYADLLRRNGYKEAKVSAYAGSREIPIETALKLFERKN